MNEQFQALPIDHQHAIVAYPLVFMHDASITTDQWLRFVRRRCRGSSPETGLIAIRDRRGVIHALFSYRIDNDLRVRKRLSIGDLIVAHLPGSRIDDALPDRHHRAAIRNASCAARRMPDCRGAAAPSARQLTSRCVAVRSQPPNAPAPLPPWSCGSSLAAAGRSTVDGATACASS
ncbi:hypothetical protein ACVIWU_001774 [Bradyrhizobium sp. USDA 4509]